MLSGRLLLLVFLVALGLRLGYFWAIHSGSLGNGDSPAYEDLAYHLLHRQPYMSSQPGGPGGFPADLERPPGYPLFLAVIGEVIGPNRQSTALVQCVLNAMLAVILAVSVGRLSNERAGLIAGLLYATDWITIIHVPLTIAETLFVVLLGLAICLYALNLANNRAITAISAGLFLGLAALVKPVGQLAAPAFLISWIVQKKRRTTTLLFLVSYLACVTPWMVRNYRRHELFTLSEIGTVDLYFYTAQASMRTYSLADFGSVTLNEEVSRSSRESIQHRLSPREQKNAMQREAWSLIRQHWAAVISHGVIGFARTCIGTGFVTVSQSLPQPPSRFTRIVFALLPGVQVAVVWFSGLVAVWSNKLLSSLGRGNRVMLITTVIVLLIPAASSMGQSRFRVPAVAPLCMLAGMGISAYWQKRFNCYRGANC